MILTHLVPSGARELVPSLGWQQVAPRGQLGESKYPNEIQIRRDPLQ